MRVWHPDRFEGDAALKEKAEKKTREINEAYQRVLRYQEAPSRASGRPGEATAQALQTAGKRRGFFRSLLFIALLLAVLFGGLYLYFIAKENADKLRVGGVTFREWEWNRFFKPGSTKDEVLAVQGAPDRVSGETWWYGTAAVTFAGGRVAGYSNADGNLRVRVLPENPLSLPPSSFSIGATKDEVLAVQGTPTRLKGETWYYGADSIFFSGGVVSKVHNVRRVLRFDPIAQKAPER